MFRKNLLSAGLIILIYSVNLLGQDIPSCKNLMKIEKLREAKICFKSLLNSKSKGEACFYLGEIYLSEVDEDSAKISYEMGIAADPDYPSNYAGLVKIYFLKNNNTEAEKYYKQAIDIGEDDPATYVHLSEAYSLYQKDHNYDKALNLTDEALKLNPKFVEAYITRGNINLKKGNGTEAINNFEEAIDLAPTNPEPIVLKAKVYSMIKNYNEASSLLDKALEIDPAYSPVYRELAELNFSLKNYSKAAEYYSQYIESSEITIEKQKRFTTILFINQEYDKVINILTDVNSKDPNNASTLRVLAYSYLRIDEIDSSKAYFKRLFDLPSAEYLGSDYENYADLLSKTGNDSLAIEYLTKMIEQDSTRKDVYGKISILYYKNQNWNGVISSLKSKGDLTAQEYFDLGKASYFVNEYTQADTAFSELIKRVPDLTVAYFWQARVKTNFDPESDSGFAKPYYEKFIELAKEDTARYRNDLIEAYSYLGYYYFLQGDKVSSKSNWQKVYALDPTNNQAIEALKHL